MRDELAEELGFGAACEGERIVFGSSRPSYPFHRVPAHLVDQWLDFIAGRGIRRVVSLLMPEQLMYYDDLLDRYRAHFGGERVGYAPIPDLFLAEPPTLTQDILPFLAHADRSSDPTVVHCSAGVGRTGHILAAWLVAGRGFTNQEAIAVVARGGRDARESGDSGLDALLDACRAWGTGD